MLVACGVTTSLQLDALQEMGDVDQLEQDVLPNIKRNQGSIFKLQNC